MTIEDIAKERADWLLDAVACATQNRQFLRGEPEYDEVAGDAILMNGEKAIRVAIDRALSSTKSEKVAVKALEWEQPNAFLASAKGLFGFVYTLQRGTDGWFSRWGSKETDKTLEHLQATAQEHFDIAIRSALASEPANG